VRIAVVDSGVHPAHDHINAARLEPGVAVLADGSLVTGADATLDRLGHGTAVMAAIQEKAPGATCVPVRVFGDSLKSSAAGLIAAIRWAIGQDAAIINLSLGTPNPAHRSAMADVVEEGLEAGAVIVAARENGGIPVYPGALPGVIGVGLDWDCPRSSYRCEPGGDGPIFLASGYPRAIPGVPQRRNLHGISFATAQMAGFSAIACERLGPERKRDPAGVATLAELLSAQALEQSLSKNPA
jgi:subtilisin family serine protease